MLNSCVLFYSFVRLDIASLLYNNFLCKYYIFSWFRNVDHGPGRATTVGVITRLFVWSQ